MLALRKIYKVLRKDGIYILLLKIIEKSHSSYFRKLIVKRKWKQASYIGERLVALYPEKAEYHLELADCYRKNNENERANIIIEKYKNLHFNLTEAIQEVEKRISLGKTIKSRYIQLGGMQNCGFIEHLVDNNKTYLTKISSGLRWREKFFYLKVYNQYPRIREITPKLVNFLEIDGYNEIFITTEKIEGKEPELTEKVIEDVIKANKVVTSIKYNEVYDWFPVSGINKLNEVFSKKGGPSFTMIQSEMTNKKVFKVLFSKMEKLNYSLNSLKLIKRLEHIIVDNEMYKQIRPEIHYSLQHGDLKKDNLVIEKQSGKLLYLDWGVLRLGPSWYDMAGFLAESKLSFKKINTLFLSNEDAGLYDPIEKLFFIYTLVVIWFNMLSKDEFDNRHDLYLGLAIEYSEYLMQEIIKSKDNFVSKKSKNENLLTSV